MVSKDEAASLVPVGQTASTYLLRGEGSAESHGWPHSEESGEQWVTSESRTGVVTATVRTAPTKPQG